MNMGEKNREELICEIEELKKELHIIQNSLDAVQDVFYIFNAEGTMLRWNRTTNNVTGYSNDEIMSMKAEDFFAGEDVQRVMEAVHMAFEQGSARVEANYLTKDGRKIPYEFTGSVLLDPEGTVVGLCGTGRDISERKADENHLKEKNDIIDQTNKELERKVNELEVALNHIKRLEGLIPICSSCKKILPKGANSKDVKSWQSMEEYISKRSEASFTHGLCPDCVKIMYDRGIAGTQQNGEGI